MLLRRLVLAARLYVRHLRIVHQLARQRAFLEQLLPAVVDFLRGLHRLLIGPRIGLRLHHLFRHRRRRGAAIVSLRLVELPFAFLGRRRQVAILQQRQQLSLPHMIAPVYIKRPHRRADLRHHRGLVPRI